MYDLIIIGGGPAGITSGIYAAREKLKTLLITKDFRGQIANKSLLIENYPGFEQISGIELLQKLEAQVRKQEIEIKIETVVKVEKTGQDFIILTENQNKFFAKAVIIATGANPRPLKVPGEKEFLGKGVGYCATCDAPLFKNKIVAVVGGGNTALEYAVALTKWAKQVYLMVREEEIVAEQAIQERVKADSKIKIIKPALLKEIKGEKFVNLVVYQDLKTGVMVELKEVEGVFVAIGTIPATSFVRELVDFSQLGEIVVDPQTGETKTPGLFAAGDVDNLSYRQIVIAAGEGAKVAISASHYLMKNVKN